MTAGFQSEMFDVLPRDAAEPHRRTPAGEPWVTWQKHQNYGGWCAPGTRSLRGATPVFWHITLGAASAVLGTRVDTVHAVGPAILSVGALGLTFRSGYGQLLLGECVKHEPFAFFNAMAPVLVTGARLRLTNKSPSGVALVAENGSSALTAAEIAEIVCLGSGPTKWTRQAEKHARIWVSSVSALLRDECMDWAQERVTCLVLPKMISGRSALQLRWPRDGAEGTWQYTRERQALWAFAMILGIFGRAVAETLWDEVFDKATGDGDEELIASLVGILRGRHGDGSPRRARRILRHVAQGFGVEFEGMDTFEVEE